MREVRSLFNLPSRGSAPKSELVFPASKELQPPSIATPDTLELDASHDASELPLPDDMQVKLDRDSVNAENARVYDRDLDLANDCAKEQRALRRMNQLAKKFGCELTAARKLDLKLAAIWENAFLTVRHKASYTPDNDKTQLLLGDQQEQYRVPAKLRQRDFFATADGFIGMAPATLEIGDEVIVPFGASRPFVVRSHGDHHVLIGDAVVPGIMSGQMVNLCTEGTVAAREYLLK
ncbi:hypothetical protein LTR91_014494 [Friedmanniomyces endolithicus]|uniref:Uncharacterized protein n=1 Tax=Friedmanniomyces endolithicus TaxID=329885 RepID=A0AAN6KBV8_9PEZI|nr:hypothetical protein LTR57_022920 [Friedmanniomyces endolithicus]KAK0974137.1 hypothetical protein LTR91_014494 [Friedmanniomyces endolithicus]KAK1001626.1 hypothetical protein LTS01_004533 [Friedmanniomyces endolithicus]KAK1041561.1 hypothetical protein LTS16_009539 [Friedmanniomyces endolithicus]